ncbi:MAG: hypothetical protein KY467_10670 [Gemmatimonadetes bacterium]|nr:hypothetical protein [Gemmatimonadota bacterium]
MRLRSLFLPLLALLPFAAPPAQPVTRVVSGYYTVGWEEQSFRPCGQRAKWWVSNPGPMMGAYADLVEGDWGTIFVTVRVDLTDEGNWGHLGGYRRAMAVTELLDARVPSPDRDDCSRVRET